MWARCLPISPSASRASCPTRNKVLSWGFGVGVNVSTTNQTRGSSAALLYLTIGVLLMLLAVPAAFATYYLVILSGFFLAGTGWMITAIAAGGLTLLIPGVALSLAAGSVKSSMSVARKLRPILWLALVGFNPVLLTFVIIMVNK